MFSAVNFLAVDQEPFHPIFVLNNMFCPRCGKAEQQPETYCRQCGLFLPDLTKPVKREPPPEDHLKANAVLSALTIVASFVLSILLYAILGFRSNTHPLIYVTASLLLGIGGWHIQTLIRTLKLKKQWQRRTPLAEIQQRLQETQPAVKSASTAKLLAQADFADSLSVSVTENTTRHLVERSKPKGS
jgi:ribosomal protein S27AE